MVLLWSPFFLFWPNWFLFEVARARRRVDQGIDDLLDSCWCDVAMGGVQVPEVPDAIRAQEQVGQSMLLMPWCNQQRPAFWTHHLLHHSGLYWPISLFLQPDDGRRFYYKSTIWWLSVLLTYICINSLRSRFNTLRVVWTINLMTRWRVVSQRVCLAISFTEGETVGSLTEKDLGASAAISSISHSR